MSYILQYHEKILKDDIPKLPRRTKDRLKNTIETKLAANPETFGLPLRRSLKGYRKLRVGDYRIVFKITGKTVKILIIAHRSVVYQKIFSRI